MADKEEKQEKKENSTEPTEEKNKASQGEQKENQAENSESNSTKKREPIDINELFEREKQRHKLESRPQIQIGFKSLVGMMLFLLTFYVTFTFLSAWLQISGGNIQQEQADKAVENVTAVVTENIEHETIEPLALYDRYPLVSSVLETSSIKFTLQRIVYTDKFNVSQYYNVMYKDKDKIVTKAIDINFLTLKMDLDELGEKEPYIEIHKEKTEFILHVPKYTVIETIG